MADSKEEEFFKEWEDKNDEAFGILIVNLSPEQAGIFIGETNAKTVWDELKPEMIYSSSHLPEEDAHIWNLDSGCTSHMSPREDWLINKIPIDSEINLAEEERFIKAEAQGDVKLSTYTSEDVWLIMEIKTIFRRLVANVLHSCRPLRRLPLTPPNRRQRLEWCRARSTWMTEWHRVVFSDESRFCLSSDSRRVRVWRRRGERSNPAAIVERPTVRQRGIMVWGAIAYDSRSPLLRIQGTMTAQRYVDDVLRPVTLPYLQGVPNAPYQQDNARPHTARISQQALQDVQMLPWPPYSPDLSPIEHVWDIIGRRLHALPHPRSEDELWQMKKFEFWAKKYGFPLHPPTSSKDTIVNLTDIKFTDHQTSLLMKGLDFRLPRESDPLYTISCIESALQHQSHTDKFRIRSFIANKLQPTPRKSSLSLRCNNQDITALKSLKAQHDILITKSDKGSQVVVLRTQDYKQKMTDILADPNTFHEISPNQVKDIANSYETALRSLKRTKGITSDQFLTFTSNISGVPYIYGLPKTHKPDIPLRPIVAYHLSPAFLLAKYLCTLLKPLVSSHNIHSVKDPTDFISRLRNIPRSDCRAMSTFDVTSLFLCLPHSLIIEGLKQLLLSSTFPTKEQQVILDLFNICLVLNTLEFHGSFFIQTRSSPMGSPLSTIAAEIVMSNLDRWILSHNHLGFELWSRLNSVSLLYLYNGEKYFKIQPPESFDFSTPNEWPKWRKRFERYLVVSGMKKKEEAYKIDLFMYLMGDRADDIFRTFKFEKEEEATKIDSVLKAFDSHFCVRKNIIYERAKFNSRIQEDREPVDEFITSLYKLADSCEFEGLHEQLIRDRIVVGVRNKALSERMQLDSELTLEKAVKMVRQQEAVRQQQVDLQRPSTSQKVNQVKFNSKKRSPKQQEQPSRKKEKSAKTRSRCPKCGGFTHREGQACRAEGQRCYLCSKTGHFANCCPDKQAKTAEFKAVSELDEEIGFLLEVSAAEDSSNLDDDEGECRRRWTAEIQVNGKQVKFKLDSQADVTCVPLCLFKKIMGQQRLVESDINLRAAEFSELQTVGLGQIGNPYEIKLKPGAKPYALHTPRRVTIPLMEKLKTRLEELDKDEILTKIFEAQQEDTTLKAVVNYLEQGWPNKKMSQALLSYWHVMDELGVQNGLLMRSCHLVIPASMKLEILDKLHAGHFGITKTRLRARETVWWPGISEEIAETVRKCSVCIQEAVSKHEPLIPTNFPTRPWQKIGMDLFKFENKWYLVVIDYYSRFPEVVQLDRLTANVVVRGCKSIFARHGIPETVVSDNGTQFGAAREFSNFARQYGFTHVTSSPRFPQSNGMAEAGVKIAKLILKKNQDPSLGLLDNRSTPLENGYSPAELLMGRKLRTTLPIAPENLNPKLVDSQALKRKEGRRRKDMKSRYDRRCGATDMEELSEGDTVWITDMRTWGIVKKKASTPRSYMVDTPVGTLRRNRFHLRKGYAVQYPADPSTPTFSGEELVENEKTPVVDFPSNDSEDGQIRTRSGRIVKPVDRLHC
ncbi:hypothetical protein LAZ67_7002451 [Cordylochernes scorpioides]|uniref:RNA-directed DNA polymerase n=1 Tax=Cordylochernes scorpioides TaxID=51811 RepID=A0ABY6KPT2_9ARAC|nr:hypothetical protein LAZ67_7002451 [Cordylochernes scorpioides]